MQSQKKYKRIVVKIGSSLFYSKEAKLDVNLISGFAREIAVLIKEGKEIVVISSGAIALGMSILKIVNRPKNLSLLQAAAAIGQHELMDAYRKFFKEVSLSCGQLLLTWDDFSSRARYLNAKNTINTLLKLNSVPVVNENDTVSTDEIKFGDNDRLSALVATMVGADILIMLSDIDGLMDKDKQVIRVVDKITPEIKASASSTSKNTSVGGMITKIEAAAICIHSGIPCVIANGRKKGIIKLSIDDPLNSGTVFLAKGDLLDAKKRWMAFGTKAKGNIIVDDGAKKALINKKSLLAVGVVSCDGGFACGDIVGICDSKGCVFARGKVVLSAKELEKAKGARFAKEIVHRDNIVLL
ncbi:MAG: glutamate 5-kinase [Candidatus Omnitrophica bacterium]|nr:glutamate 5-kinase [Candidatus Omnitrophota bacterium]